MLTWPGGSRRMPSHSRQTPPTYRPLQLSLLNLSAYIHTYIHKENWENDMVMYVYVIDFIVVG